MIHTEKRYKLVGSAYIEDPNGFIIGFSWTDSDSIDRRCLYIASSDDLQSEVTVAICRYEMKDPQNGEWVLRKIDSSSAKMDSFVHPDGSLESNPYDGNGDLKPGLIPEFKFFFDLQLQLFANVMKSIQTRKFGATGFN